MRIARLSAASEGSSCLGDTHLPLRNSGPAGPATPVEQAHRVHFRELLATGGPWEPGPRRQYVVVLGGALDVQDAEGCTERLGRGAVLLVEDAGGKGHRIVPSGEETCCVLLVDLDDAPAPDLVGQASRESFPASDPPGWTGTAGT